MDRIDFINKLHLLLDYELEQLMRDLERSLPQTAAE